MNLYKLHAKPESLDHHDLAHDQIPVLFWDKFGHDKVELKKRELSIAEDPKYSFQYAKYVLKGPFKAGEEAIAKNAKYSVYYARDVLRKPFPAGEAAIAKDANYSGQYAWGVLKGRFKAGEAAIAKDPEFADMYTDFINDLDE